MTGETYVNGRDTMRASQGGARWTLLFFYILEVDVFALRTVDFLLVLFGVGVPGGTAALCTVLILAAEGVTGSTFATSEKEARDEAYDHLDKSQQGDEEDDEKYNQ